jgi:hypothetical protein
LEAVYTEGTRLVRHEPIAELWGVDDLDVTIDGTVAVVTYAPDGGSGRQRCAELWKVTRHSFIVDRSPITRRGVR